MKVELTEPDVYADDIAIIAESVEDLQAKLDVAEHHANINRYKFGVAKCEAILTDLKTMEEDDQTIVTLYQQPLKKSHAFKYLGVMVDQDGVNTRLSLEKSAVNFKQRSQKLVGMGIRTGIFPPWTVISILNTFARPILEYGAILWDLENKRWMNMFTSTYFDALCAALRIDRFVCRSRLCAAIKEIMPVDRLRLARGLSMLRWETLSPDFLVSHATKDAKVGMSKDSHIKRLRSQGEVEALTNR